MNVDQAIDALLKSNDDDAPPLEAVAVLLRTHFRQQERIATALEVLAAPHLDDGK